jgi:hypothetical protein
MPEESNKDVFVGAETKQGVRIEGPFSPQDASSRKTIIEGQEDTFAATMHAKNLGQAIIKILTTFINREKHV